MIKCPQVDAVPLCEEGYKLISQVNNISLSESECSSSGREECIPKTVSYYYL